MKKKWYFINPGKNQDFSILKDAGFSNLISMVLMNRNISDPSMVKRFFSPTLKDLEDPFLLPDMARGIERVVRALKLNEKIVIYGDYDVDGTTGTTLLYSSLQKLGGNVSYYLPHRLKEGYGLNLNAINYFASSGITLIITVDCGTTNLKEIDFANSKGIDVIVTDHHEPDEDNIPSSYALINPKIKTSLYPFPHLAGVGVVFKFIQALSSYLPALEWESYIGLTALGTIADIVPMTGENRVISCLGLNYLNSTPGAGIKALMEKSSIDKLDTNGVLFKIAPKINALGRLDCASFAIKLLFSSDITEAREFAMIAENRNTERKSIQDRIMMDTFSMLEKNEFKSSRSPIILASDNWHIGVLGIVASKLVEQYYRPVYLIMCNSHEAKGSARGIDGFSIFDSLCFCQDILNKFGGHELAGGFSLDVSRIDTFADKMECYVEDKLSDEMLCPGINIEGEALFSEIDMNLARDFKAMEPFGNENPVPVFYSHGVKVLNSRFMGRDDEHFKLILQQGEVTQEAVGFKMGLSHSHLIHPGSIIDMVYSIDIDYWRDEPLLRLTIKDLRPAEKPYIKISNNNNININFLKDREVTFSNEEKKVIDKFFHDKKVVVSMANLNELMELVHYLIFLTLYERMKKLVIVHPLRVEANRHYKFLKSYLASKGIKVFLLTGSLNGIERERVLETLKADFPCLIITTFDYLCCYKNFFHYQWHNTDIVIIDDNLLNYSSNMLIQLEDISHETGFLFFTLNHTLKSDHNIKLNSQGKTEIFPNFNMKDILNLDGKTVLYSQNINDIKDFQAMLPENISFVISPELKEEQKKKNLEKFKSGEVKYLFSSSSSLYEILSLDVDNIVILDSPFSWNEFYLLLNSCRKLYLGFSKNDIEKNRLFIYSKMPDRQQLIKCYQLLRSRYGGGAISLLSSHSLSKEIGPELLKTCLTIFEEIRLYKVIYHRTGYSLTMLEHKEKLDLLSSPCYLECIKTREHFDKLAEVLIDPERVKNKL